MKKKTLTQNQWFRFTNMAEGATEAELQLFGYIGEWERINHQDLTEAIERLPTSVKTLRLIINSGGGEVREGNAIGNSLQALKQKRELTIETHVYYAASMAGLVALVGDTIIGYPDSVWHAHEVKGGVYGGARDLRQYADHMDQLNAVGAKKYAKRTGISEEQILDEWMSPGTEKYFNADEALEIGLFDNLVDYGANNAPSNQLKGKDLHEHFNRIINHVEMDENKKPLAESKEAIVNAVKASGHQVLIAQVEASESIAEMIIGQHLQITAKKEEILSLKNRLEAEKTAKAEADAEQFAQALVDQKKIVASQKGLYKSQFLNNKEEAEQFAQNLEAPANIHEVIEPLNKEADKTDKEAKESKPEVPLNAIQKRLLAMQKAFKKEK